MATSSQLVALALAIVFVAACAQPADGTPVPLVLESHAPSRPPTLEVRIGSHDVQRGVIYTTDWSTARVVSMQQPRVPVPWPGVARVDPRGDVALRFDTAVAPDFVTVSTFAHVARPTGVPTTAPIATYECARFAVPKCDVTRAVSGLLLRVLESRALSGEYLTVFCTWHVPRSEQHAGANPPVDVTGSWLFHIRDRRAATAP